MVIKTKEKKGGQGFSMLTSDMKMDAIPDPPSSAAISEDHPRIESPKDDEPIEPFGCHLALARALRGRKLHSPARALHVEKQQSQ